jgi:SEC-C motif
VRLRRNEPCHCESGKKYKHCHLDSDQELASRRRLVQKHDLVDVITSKLAELALADPVAFDAERHREAREVRAPFLKIIGSGLTGKLAADALAQQLEAIEQVVYVEGTEDRSVCPNIERAAVRLQSSSSSLFWARRTTRVRGWWRWFSLNLRRRSSSLRTHLRRRRGHALPQPHLRLHARSLLLDGNLEHPSLIGHWTGPRAGGTSWALVELTSPNR